MMTESDHRVLMCCVDCGKSGGLEKHGELAGEGSQGKDWNSTGVDQTAVQNHFGGKRA